MNNKIIQLFSFRLAVFLDHKNVTICNLNGRILKITRSAKIIPKLFGIFA